MQDELDKQDGGWCGSLEKKKAIYGQALEKYNALSMNDFDAQDLAECTDLDLGAAGNEG